jgi:hypothetical protein
MQPLPPGLPPGVAQHALNFQNRIQHQPPGGVGPMPPGNVPQPTPSPLQPVPLMRLLALIAGVALVALLLF